MDLKLLRQRLARLGATVAPPRRLHPGLIVRFGDCIGQARTPARCARPDARGPRPRARSGHRLA